MSMTNKPMPELLPLPEPLAISYGMSGMKNGAYLTDKQVREYAIAYGAECIRAMSEQEPVEYQYRMRPMWREEGKGWIVWTACSKESFEDYSRISTYNNWQYEVRKLYVTPQAIDAPEPSNQHVISDSPPLLPMDWPPPSALEFDDFLNNPPSYESERMVRDYRHEAYPKWKKVVEDMRALLSRQPAEQQAPDDDGHMLTIAYMSGYAKGKDAGRLLASRVVASEQVAPEVPPGYALVPIRLTVEMEISGMEESVIGRPSVDDEAYVTNIWRAILAAAPSQQNEQGKDGGV